MAKRSTSRTLLVVQLAPLRLVILQETDETPSSSFPAAPVHDDKPGLAKAEPTSADYFPFAKRVSR